MKNLGEYISFSRLRSSNNFFRSKSSISSLSRFSVSSSFFILFTLFQEIFFIRIVFALCLIDQYIIVNGFEVGANIVCVCYRIILIELFTIFVCSCLYIFCSRRKCFFMRINRSSNRTSSNFIASQRNTIVSNLIKFLIVQLVIISRSRSQLCFYIVFNEFS